MANRLCLHHKAQHNSVFKASMSPFLGLQGLDIAVVKATTSAFHVAPKEKHVRTLKMAVYPGGQHRGTTYIITELISRLHQSTDWLVSASRPPRSSMLLQAIGFYLIQQLMAHDVPPQLSDAGCPSYMCKRTW